MKKFLVENNFEYRKFQPGQVKFSASSWSDPHIQKVAKDIATARGVTVQDIETEVNNKLNEFRDIEQKAPILYQTIKQNIVEDSLWTLFSETDIPTSAPRFSVTTFYRLVRSIRADHDEFFPLRGFIDRRRLMNPQFIFVGDGSEASKKYEKKVKTAAATPNGQFIFNTHFMQKLMDYSFLKGVHPKGRKYVSNGGDIPDEYGYIEFLIMHEFMHYSNDDFYYQKIIPKANPQIINWVGDFRTNYLLVKSGYEQLPMGLYNDAINYDRQRSYIEMYNLVKSEFDKLKSDQQKKVGDAMDGMSDDHEPGNEEGEQGEVPEGTDTGKIDEAGDKIKRQMKDSKDGDAKDRAERDKQEAERAAAEQEKSDQPGGRGKVEAHEVDYSKIRPTFNWKAIIKKFVSSATAKMEQTYSKPARRSATGLEIARQVGAAAIKPAEKPLEYSDAKLGFVFDSSGSMGGIIEKVFSNALQLLRHPMFARSSVLVTKFSGHHEMYKCIFRSNKAAQVHNVNEKVKQFNMTTQQVFSMHFGAGTVFGPEIVADLMPAFKERYNMVFFLDSDILYGENFTSFMELLRAFPKQIFVIFDDRDTYISFRKQAGMSTPNITYFE